MIRGMIMVMMMVMDVCPVFDRVRATRRVTPLITLETHHQNNIERLIPTPRTPQWAKANLAKFTRQQQVRIYDIPPLWSVQYSLANHSPPPNLQKSSLSSSQKSSFTPVSAVSSSIRSRTISEVSPTATRAPTVASCTGTRIP